MVFCNLQLGKEINMDFIIDEREISEKDKARPAEHSEEKSSERSIKNEPSTAT